MTCDHGEKTIKNWSAAATANARTSTIPARFFQNVLPWCRAPHAPGLSRDRLQRRVDGAHDAFGRILDCDLAGKLQRERALDHARAEALALRRLDRAARRARATTSGSGRPRRSSSRPHGRPSVESAPYLIALVASSCTAIESATALCGDRCSVGPVDREALARPGRRAARNAERTMSCSSALSQLCCVSMPCTLLNVIRRPSNARCTAGSTLLWRKVCAAIDCTIASVFLTRCSSSLISRSRCSSALLAVGGVAEHDAEAVAERKQPVGHPAALEHDGLGLGSDGLAARHGLVEEPAEPGLARAGERLPQHAAEHVLRLAAEMPRRLAVEQDDAPVAIDRVKALADAVEDRAEARFGAQRGDLLGNEGLRIGRRHLG